MDGMVLDGRRRWLACSIAQIKPLTREVCVADPVAYVLSLNLHRRHLNTSQLAMVAARARELYDEQAKERMKEGGRKGGQNKGKENLPCPSSEQQARDAAGKAVGVSGRSVDFAKKVIEQGTPELVKAVDEGKMAVSTAAFYATEPEEVQRTVVSNPKRNRKYSGAAGGGQQDQDQDQQPEPPAKRNGKPPVGVTLANEALNVLMRIPKDDPLRKRGFQIVTDWIRTNR
jgi:hypothetical protein